MKDFDEAGKMWKVGDIDEAGKMWKGHSAANASVVQNYVTAGSLPSPPSLPSLQRAAEESRLFVRALLQPHHGDASEGCEDAPALEDGRGEGRAAAKLMRSGALTCVEASGRVTASGLVSDPNNDNDTAEERVLWSGRALQEVAAQLQALGYEAGVWDLMGAVQLARRALDALTSILAGV